MYPSRFRAWFFLGVLVPTAVLPAGAMAQDISPSSEVAQVFNDLPGVQPQEPLNAPNKVVCEQIVERRPGVEPTNGPLYHVLNSCSSDGGLVFRSPMLPRSLERLKRGLPY
ncbi:hypothetical protein [Pararhizobium arenae]|uniref:hypothetical protein n=1 Tax=Pararhizobium arenae TaxID=1856850 RepID=UPI00094ACBAE|nr:hypothetical protein [Pararhizobium arenae]